MGRANVPDRILTIIGKAGARVSTKKPETCTLAVITPKLLQTHCRLAIPSRPQERHHLTEHTNRSSRSSSAQQEFPHRLPETSLIRQACGHKPGEGLLRVSFDITVHRRCHREIDVLLGKTSVYSSPMSVRGDHNHYFIPANSSRDECG